MLSSILAIIALLIVIAITHYIRKWAEKREKNVPHP